ncbi:MAG TPA: YegS/Rv2252/BmrU family lipid kinase [Candidatus Acidoferrum sp.]|nr:YegS/Rv2252/BmrU family lipid kinase [Candidatus Acidoferrum sp.]
MTKLAKDSESSVANRFTRAVVFVNVHSGRGRSSKFLPRFGPVFRSHGISVETIETSSAEELTAHAKQQIGAGVRLFFSAGGDGTCQGLVNAVYGNDVVVGLIPAGGGNDFARALGLPANPISALHVGLAGEPRPVDLVKIVTADGRVRLYLGGGGIGLEAATAQHASTRYRNWPGRLRYLAAAIRAYAACEPSRIRITLEPAEGAAVWQSALLASVLNTPTFGAGIRIAPTAKIDDGLLNLVLLDELRVGRLLLLLPRLALRGTLNLPALRTMTVRRLRIETERPAMFEGDGELLGPTPVEIEVVPRAMQFLAAKQAKR